MSRNKALAIYLSGTLGQVLMISIIVFILIKISMAMILLAGMSGENEKAVFGG